MKEQSLPIKNQNPPVWDLVIEDMKNRNKIGIERYGVALQGFNGRNVLQDIYEELLDAAVYLRQLIYEQNSK